MPDFCLHIAASTQDQITDDKFAFYWTSSYTTSSFISTFGPGLGGVGPVVSVNVDLVRIAATVIAADRSTTRRGGGSNWNCRDIGLTVPVYHPDRWRAVDNDLRDLLGMLTGDQWRFDFIRTPNLEEEIVPAEQGPKRVVLLSGGADSAIGAFESARTVGASGHILVSHVGATFSAPIQQGVVTQIGSLFPNILQKHLQIRFSRKADQMSGQPFPNEFSMRSRSFLFIALGLAVASCHRLPLWIPENGFASLNPPLSPERRGALSTRTTHPAFIAGLVDILQAVGAHADVSNPFIDLTKGEMFTQLAAKIGDTEASRFLSSTHSCGHTGQRSFSTSPRTHCGVCFGCILRKASFEVSNIEDHTSYIDSAPGSRLERWLKTKNVESSVRYFIQKGVGVREIASMGLPPGYSASDAQDICNRGLKELARLYP